MSRNGLWRYLRDVRNEDGTTVFLTTHYLEEAEEADRVCVVDHGRIAMIGSPDHMKRAAARALDRARRRRPRRPARRAATASASAPAIDPTGLVRVAYEGDTAQALISRIRTPLSVLRVHEPSLEEAYVELVCASSQEAA